MVVPTDTMMAGCGSAWQVGRYSELPCEVEQLAAYCSRPMNPNHVSYMQACTSVHDSTACCAEHCVNAAAIKRQIWHLVLP